MNDLLGEVAEAEVIKPLTQILLEEQVRILKEKVAAPECRSVELLQKHIYDLEERLNDKYSIIEPKPSAAGYSENKAVLQLRALTADLKANSQLSKSGVLKQSKIEQKISNALSQANPEHSDVRGSFKANDTEAASISLISEFGNQHHINRLLKSAWDARPENPGPINPHMLGLKSLSMMQALSEDYLKHFVAQLDTLFILENQADAKGKKGKKT